LFLAATFASTTNRAVESLKKMEGLKQLVVYNTGFNENGFKELSKSRPRLLILYRTE
jgi:hypothetical protein